MHLICQGGTFVEDLGGLALQSIVQLRDASVYSVIVALHIVVTFALLGQYICQILDWVDCSRPW